MCWFYPRIKISVSMDISVLGFYGYIGDISDISEIYRIYRRYIGYIGDILVDIYIFNLYIKTLSY